MRGMKLTQKRPLKAPTPLWDPWCMPMAKKNKQKSPQRSLINYLLRVHEQTMMAQDGAHPKHATPDVPDPAASPTAPSELSKYLPQLTKTDLYGVPETITDLYKAIKRLLRYLLPDQPEDSFICDRLHWALRPKPPPEMPPRALPLYLSCQTLHLIQRDIKKCIWNNKPLRFGKLLTHRLMSWRGLWLPNKWLYYL